MTRWEERLGLWWLPGRLLCCGIARRPKIAQHKRRTPDERAARHSVAALPPPAGAYRCTVYRLTGTPVHPFTAEGRWLCIPPSRVVCPFHAVLLNCPVPPPPPRRAPPPSNPHPPQKKKTTL